MRHFDQQIHFKEGKRRFAYCHFDYCRFAYDGVATMMFRLRRFGYLGETAMATGLVAPQG